MARRKVFTRGLAAVAALLVPIWMTAQPASAFESYGKTVTLEHTFTDAAGDEVTCQVDFTSNLFRETHSAPLDADASTQVGSDFTGPEDDRCTAFVGVEITYRDRQGVEHHQRAFGRDLADLQIDGLNTNFVASHLVIFDPCALNCEFNYTTSPK